MAIFGKSWTFFSSRSASLFLISGPVPEALFRVVGVKREILPGLFDEQQARHVQKCEFICMYVAAAQALPVLPGLVCGLCGGPEGEESVWFPPFLCQTRGCGG